MSPPIVTRYTGVNCLGAGVDPWWAALRERRSGLAPCDFEDVALETFIGRVPGVEDVVLPEALAAFDCRNNRLAQLGLAQDGFGDAVAAARERYGPRRIGVILGTSTSGVLHDRTRVPATAIPRAGALPATFRVRRHAEHLLARGVRAQPASGSKDRRTSCPPPVRPARRSLAARRG